MRINLLLAALYCLLLCGCSSDPCEELNCVNGQCVDGTCQCEEGFVGVTCNELPCVNGSFSNGECNCTTGSFGKLCDVDEIVGFYSITQLLHTDCPDYAKAYDLMADVSDGRVCGTNHTDLGICFSNGLNIAADGTAFWIRSIVLEPTPGSFETTWLEFEEGTYTAQNESITINLENGETRVVTISQDKLTWERNTSDGGPECIWKEEYTISRN